VENNTFYFGMGIPYVFSAKNGIILEVTIKWKNIFIVL
jgi:hypothetical protein